MENDFNFELLKRLDTMNDSLTAMNNRISDFEGETRKSLSELSGRIKGNHELIKSDIQSYVQKDTCERHRERQGERIGLNENKIGILYHDLETIRKEIDAKNATARERFTSFLPDIVKIVLIGGALIGIKFLGVI